jgi:type II secretory pathway component GspD/PulD (secretin)
MYVRACALVVGVALSACVSDRPSASEQPSATEQPSGKEGEASKTAGERSGWDLRVFGDKDAKRQDEEAIAALRELVERGALTPVDSMGDADFSDPLPDAKNPFDAAETANKPAPLVTPPTDPVQAFKENPYLVFGSRIVVYPSKQLISKPFPLRTGTGAKLEKLLRLIGPFELYDQKTATEPQKPTQVRLDLEEKWDQENFTSLRLELIDDAKSRVDVADWLVVTAGFDALREVQDFINTFAAGVPQIEIEAKIVEVSLTDVLDIGVKPIDNQTPIFGFPDHAFVRGLTYSLPNFASSTAANSLLQLGGVQDGVEFNAMLQALATNENVSIISRPKVAVREGGRAEIVNTIKLPNYNVSSFNAAGQASAALTYEEVGIKLYVMPRVVGTDTVALAIDIENSAQSGSSVGFTLQNGQTVSNPILSRRAAKTVVYLEPGQAVILGGLISERNVKVENKVPLLGDIPLLGQIFSSSLDRKEQTNVLFFIRPRILQGSDLNREF